MNSFVVCSLALILFLTENVYNAKIHQLPRHLKRCKFGEPDDVVSKCFGDAMEDAFKTLKDGEPSLGIQPLEPLKVLELDILQGSGPVSLNIHHRNLTIHGASQCKIITNEFDKVSGSLKGSFRCPKIVLDGAYELSGKVLLLPVRGKGKSVISLQNSKCDFYAHGTHEKRNGEYYEKYERVDFSITPEYVLLDFENLLGDDKTLSKTLNEFINENWREIIKEMKPAYESILSSVFKEVANRVFSKVPIRNIVLDFESIPRKYLES